MLNGIILNAQGKSGGLTPPKQRSGKLKSGWADFPQLVCSTFEHFKAGMTTSTTLARWILDGEHHQLNLWGVLKHHPQGVVEHLKHDVWPVAQGHNG